MNPDHERDATDRALQVERDGADNRFAERDGDIEEAADATCNSPATAPTQYSDTERA